MSERSASVVDGDLHRQLLDPANYSDALYARAVKPLVRFHSANPDIYYLYTMVEKDGKTFFVLDTAAYPDLRTARELKASAYMEPFEIREEYDDGWTKEVAAGKTYVTPSFEQDEYGNFLTAHAPIYDSQGRYSGFVGQGMPLAGAPFSVSIGISVHEGGGADFSRIYREADTALHQSRAEGRNRVSVFASSTAALQPDHLPKITV